MSENINVVVLTGNLTRDAELTETRGGTQVLRFGVAVNERRRNQQTDQWEDLPNFTNFIDCTLFGNRAQAVAPYMLKGTKVAVRGRLHWHSWEAQDGTKRSKVDVTVDALEFMSRGQQATRGRLRADPARHGRRGVAAGRHAAGTGAPRRPHGRGGEADGRHGRGGAGMSCNRRCRGCACGCRCGDCAHFVPIHDYVSVGDEAAWAVAGGALTRLGVQCGVGVCDADDPVLVLDTSRVSATEGWDCWQEGRGHGRVA